MGDELLTSPVKAQRFLLRGSVFSQGILLFSLSPIENQDVPWIPLPVIQIPGEACPSPMGV